MDIGGSKMQAVQSRVDAVANQIDVVTGQITKAQVALKTNDRYSIIVISVKNFCRDMTYFDVLKRC